MLAIAHRGASAYAPENTRAAFRKAIEMRADMIETDLQLTRDGEIVLIHDARLDRTTSGRGEVANASLAELRALDAGSWFGPSFVGQRIMTLAEFEIEFAARIPACLEIKAPNAAAAVVAYLSDTTAFAGAHVTSFDWNAAVLAASSLSLPVGFLTPEFTENVIERCAGHGLCQVCPHVSALTAGLVARAHDHGLLVRAWGIRERFEVDWLFETGADGATSNWPDWITGHPQYRTEART